MAEELKDLARQKTDATVLEGKILVVLPTGSQKLERKTLRMPVSDALSIQFMTQRLEIKKVNTPHRLF